MTVVLTIYAWFDYDYLVIATGAQNDTFGVPGVTEVRHSKRPPEQCNPVGFGT